MFIPCLLPVVVTISVVVGCLVVVGSAVVAFVVVVVGTAVDDFVLVELVVDSVVVVVVAGCVGGIKTGGISSESTSRYLLLALVSC